jgi:hypothetical protein
MRKFIAISLLLALVTGLYAQVTPNPFGGSGGFFDEEETRDSGKSKWAAAGLSMLVPGAGEMYLGDKRTAGYFMAAEGAVWGTYATFSVRGNWLKQEYRNYAAIHAGVRPQGKDDKFFEDVLRFRSRDSYNNWYHLVYRDQIPLYPENDEYFWEWTDYDEWDTYEAMRSKSETSYRNAKITLAAGLINRLISVVHVLRYQPSDAEITEESGFGVRPMAFTGKTPDGRLELGLGISGSF